MQDRGRVGARGQLLVLLIQFDRISLSFLPNKIILPVRAQSHGNSETCDSTNNSVPPPLYNQGLYISLDSIIWSVTP